MNEHRIEDPEEAEFLANTEKPYRDLGREHLDVPGRKELLDSLAEKKSEEIVSQQKADQFAVENALSVDGLIAEVTSEPSYVGSAGYSSAAEFTNAQQDEFAEKIKFLPQELAQMVVDDKAQLEMLISHYFNTEDYQDAVEYRRLLLESPLQYYEDQLDFVKSDLETLQQKSGPLADVEKYNQQIDKYTNIINALKHKSSF